MASAPNAWIGGLQQEGSISRKQTGDLWCLRKGQSESLNNAFYTIHTQTVQSYKRDHAEVSINIPVTRSLERANSNYREQAIRPPRQVYSLERPREEKSESKS